jgi:hypothetical protein
MIKLIAFLILLLALFSFTGCEKKDLNIKEKNLNIVQDDRYDQPNAEYTKIVKEDANTFQGEEQLSISQKTFNRWFPIKE